MGYFDFRCAVTGVSLRGAQARLFLLWASDDGLHPIAPPLLGSYDRLGAIDDVAASWSSARLLDWLSPALGAIRDKALERRRRDPTGPWAAAPIEDSGLTLSGDALWESTRVDDVDTIGNALRVLERGSTLDKQMVLVDGRPLVFMFVLAGAYDAAVATVVDAPPLPDDLDRAAGLVLDVEPAASVYFALQQLPDALRSAARADLEALHRFHAFVGARGGYRHSVNPAQFSDEQERRFAREGRERFADVLGLVAAIERHMAALELPLQPRKPRKPPPTEPTEGVGVGSRVRHATFGEGTVVAVTGAAAGLKYEVRFAAPTGTRVLLARFVAWLPPEPV